MRLRQTKTKPNAVRTAAQEAVERERRRRETSDFSRWVGLGIKAPQNPAPRFRSDEDLWLDDTPAKGTREVLPLSARDMADKERRSGNK